MAGQLEESPGVASLDFSPQYKSLVKHKMQRECSEEYNDKQVLLKRNIKTQEYSEYETLQTVHEIRTERCFSLTEAWLMFDKLHLKEPNDKTN